jgi:hypothetical protein|tara:strand:- start:212 stop:598 length:387 start_codon:yes stop_codon:yes gene_type:complete
MDEDSLSVWRSWPEAPEDERPKALYVSENLPEIVRGWLGSKQGWDIIDVRTMPNKSDADRAEGVKAFLEGVRVGSIEPGKDQLRYLELEAKICGLLSNKSRADDMVPTVKGDTLDKMLDFGKKRMRPE